MTSPGLLDQTHSSISNIKHWDGQSTTKNSLLPLELWRVVFSYLPVQELCRCAQVCHEWSYLVASIDNTAWRRHFLRSSEWRHPMWPQEDVGEAMKPWRHLYREHHRAARAWASNMHLPDTTGCIQLFHRRKERKNIYVGPTCEHQTLKSALSVASDYDRIHIAPGLYDEQFEMSSIIPFELIGQGQLGTVILVMCIEQNASTGRLCNLTLKAPWFTGHVLKVKHGHLQMDNCEVEEGQVVVESPATCHFRYCRFHKVHTLLSNVSLSIIENCEFNGLDSPAISIEGYPHEEANWAHQHMHQMSDTWGLNKTNTHHSFLGEYSASSSDFLSTTDLRTLSSATMSTLSKLPVNYPATNQLKTPKPDDEDSIGVASIAGSQVSLTDSADTFDSSSLSSTSTDEDRLQYKGHAWNSEETSAALAAAAASLDCHSSTSSSSMSSSPGDASMLHLSSSHALLPSLWSNDGHIENLLQFSFEACLETDEGLREAVQSTRGCVIRNCKIWECQGGVAVSQQGQARLEKCELRDLQYGVRCLQNAKVAILGNSIHHCTTSGIFIRLAAHGLIAGNDIYCTNEAGIDIRKNADPLVQCNRVHHCKRSGIVVLGSGCGTIKSNDIYQNREAGIYILYKGNPYVSGNRIVHGGAAGIAINEGGRGYIVDNIISANRWGSIDIRRGSDPRITHNYVCNGLADGIVIGQRGRGTIEANTIKGNVGCGVWVMGGQPLIQLNQIYNNNDTGVSFIQTRDTDEDLSTDGETDSAASAPSLSPLELQGEGMGAGEGGDEGEDEALQPRLKYNTIYHNNGYGILAQCGEQIHLSGNAIHANRNTGVYIKQPLAVSILRNSITCNSGAGLHISVDAKVIMEGNGIYDNKGHGVQVAGEVTLNQNDIFSNQLCALLVEPTADCQIENNRIHAPHHYALHIQGQARACAHKNSLYRGEAQLWNEDITTEVDLSDNQILEHKDQTENDDQAKKEPQGKTDWHLENPPARPHIEAPPTVVPHMPVRQVTTVTRVVVPSAGGCQQGSKMCVIL